MKQELLRNIEDMQECLRRVGVQVSKMGIGEDLTEADEGELDIHIGFIDARIRMMKDRLAITETPDEE